MKPIYFKNAMKTIGGPTAGQPEYLPLPIMTDGTRCLSRWQLGWWERLSALLFGKLTLILVTFQDTQPPVELRVVAFEECADDPDWPSDDHEDFEEVPA